jgi:hypothetical protein
VAQEMKSEIIHITVTRDGDFYLINFPDHPKLFTQATHIREIEPMAKDLVNLKLDIPLEAIEIRSEYLEQFALTL